MLLNKLKIFPLKLNVEKNPSREKTNLVGDVYVLKEETKFWVFLVLAAKELVLFVTTRLAIKLRFSRAF